MKSQEINKLTQALLKEVFSYDPLTGIFIRKKSTSNRNLNKVGERPEWKTDQGYYMFSIAGAKFRAHRLAWLYVFGEMPNGQIDHINGNRIDNRIVNLRACDDRENRRNQKVPRDNTSGRIGVYWCKRRETWYSRIKADGVNHFLGYQDNFSDAVIDRKAAESLYGFHENHGRLQ